MGSTGAVNFGIYCVSEAAIRNLVKLDAGPQGAVIRVNVLSPGEPFRVAEK
jgi:hypothetical protein